MANQLVGIEIDLAQIAGAIAQGLVIKVRRGRITAFAARRHGAGPHPITKLDHSDKAIAIGAVIAF